MVKILIIEDDQKIIDNISVIIKIGCSGVTIESSQRGDRGLQLIEKEYPDLVILDLRLPDMSGFDVLKELRKFSRVPVLVVSVMVEEKDIVQALELGANDYITKPFRQMELVARVRNLIRRQPIPEEIINIQCKKLRFGTSIRQLFLEDKEIGLTKTEGRILQRLIQEKGRVVTYQEIAYVLWGDSLPTALPSIKVYIRHLRKKIERNPSRPELIQNVPQMGYILVSE